jgi:hypothetical protein
MFKFEVYVSDESYVTGFEANPIKTFKDKDVMKAFNKANEWIHKEYQNDNSPDYCIVSKFGVIHI